ncbi:hypothetical protein D3C73_1250330 [compost metagenome]
MKAAKSSYPETVRDALKTIKYESAVGSVQFDDHNQARLPIILLEIVEGKIKVCGNVMGDITYRN